VTNTHMRRIIQISVLSALFAFVAFSFLAVGGVSAVSAHTINQAGSSAHTASSSTTVTVHIRPTVNGSFAIKPSAITVKVGTTVTIVNNTKVRQIIFSNNPIVFFVFSPGESDTITPQLGLEQIALYDTLSSLTITTVE
jgi:plastocyanin